jgi:hypothetical protein
MSHSNRQEESLPATIGKSFKFQVWGLHRKHLLTVLKFCFLGQEFKAK